MSLRRVPVLVLLCVSSAGIELGLLRRAEAYVALMAGQRARPLNGSFNNVPVLHSNQPEIVTGPGILVNTAAGSAIAAESNQPLRNAAYTFKDKSKHKMLHPSTVAIESIPSLEDLKEMVALIMISKLILI